MKKFGVSILASLGTFLPVLALAQDNFGEIDTFIDRIVNFINATLIPAIFAIALLIFLWGVFKYFIQGGHDEEAQSKGKQLMIYAIIGFVLMVSVWGIVNMISGGLGFSDSETINNIPNVPTSNS